MLELRKFVAPDYVFGPGARRLVGHYAANLGGSRVLVVSDRGVKEAGWTEDVALSLREAGLQVEFFDDVTPNPRMTEIAAGAEDYRERHCDLVVAVGGGSVIDCAKGIGIVASNREDIRTFEGIDEIEKPGPPLICIPTTSGTGADVSQFIIVSDIEEQRKFAIVSKLSVPDVALIDPETTLSMDADLTACTGMDALSHAVEAILSTAHSPLYDLHAQEAIRLILQALPGAVQNPDSLEHRILMSRASLQAGLAFSNASLGAVHAMAHSLGGQFDTAHGACNAILLPYVVAFNAPGHPERSRFLASAFGLEPSLETPALADQLQTFLSDFRCQVGVKGGLAELGVTRADLADLAYSACKDPCLITNPRVATPEQLEQLYARAL